MLSRIAIRWKLSLLLALSAVALVATIGVAASFLHQRMIDDRIAKLKSVVDVGAGIALTLDKDVAAGHLTRDEALGRMRSVIYSMRYDAGAGYLAFYTLDGILIASGAEPKAEGADRIGLKDVNGKLILKTMIDVLASATDGVTDYWYAKPGQTQASPKLAYFRKIPEWNAVLFTGLYVDDLEAAFTAMMVRIGLVGLLILAISAGAAVLVGRNVTQPLASLKAKMERLAAGQTDIEIPEARRGDELGAMARTVMVFRENAVQVQRLAVAQRAEQSLKDQRHATVEGSIHGFDRTVAATLDRLASASDGLQSTAQSMASMAAATSDAATTVASAAEQTSINVQTCAAASEELSSSVGEIARQVADATRIAAKAVDDAERTSVRVRTLAEAADRIGDVVHLISDVASRTNLLALNATIEAARAGEAGKGFAVVASEVKALAAQTARATGDITTQVQAIQAATGESVGAITDIIGTITQVNAIAIAIAAAVGQQGSATAEIARAMQEASAGTGAVSANIARVTDVATQAGSAARQVLDAAGALSRQGDGLRADVGRFVAEIRVA
jgi:methyl-accepting chemotaxis protein